jgi:hypothetical protein
MHTECRPGLTERLGDEEHMALELDYPASLVVEGLVLEEPVQMSPWHCQVAADTLDLEETGTGS